MRLKRSIRKDIKTADESCSTPNVRVGNCHASSCGRAKGVCLEVKRVCSTVTVRLRPRVISIRSDTTITAVTYIPKFTAARKVNGVVVDDSKDVVRVNEEALKVRPVIPRPRGDVIPSDVGAGRGIASATNPGERWLRIASRVSRIDGQAAQARKGGSRGWDIPSEELAPGVVVGDCCGAGSCADDTKANIDRDSLSPRTRSGRNIDRVAVGGIIDGRLHIALVARGRVNGALSQDAGRTCKKEKDRVNGKHQSLHNDSSPTGKNRGFLAAGRCNVVAAANDPNFNVISKSKVSIFTRSSNCAR